MEKLELEEVVQEEIPLPLEIIDRDDKKKSKDKKHEKQGFWAKIFKKKRLIKPKRVAVIYLYNNGSAETSIQETKEGFFSMNNKTYHERRDCTYMIEIERERFPLAIIPEWSLIPLGTEGWKDKTMQEKFSELQDHVLSAIRRAELVKMGAGALPALNMKTIILAGILVLIVGAVILNYV